MQRNLVFVHICSSLLSLCVIIGCCLLPFVSPTNLCSTSGLCCKHRDSECVAQRVYPNHTVDTSELPCYCDHACIELGDCCPDYRQFCGVKDCHVSEWGPWSPCSAEKCEEFGVEERHRVILHHPVNGGLKCPHLLQSKQCQAFPCDILQQERGSNERKLGVSLRQDQQREEEHERQQEQQKNVVHNQGDENDLQSQQKKQQKQSNRRQGQQQQRRNKNEQSKQHFSSKHYGYHHHDHQSSQSNHINEHQKVHWQELSGETLNRDKSSDKTQMFNADDGDENENDDNGGGVGGVLSSNRGQKVLAVKRRKEDKRSKSDADNVNSGGGTDEEGERRGCMEMVIIKTSSGCHIHDKRLRLGTRICVECWTNRRQLRSHTRQENNNNNNISNNIHSGDKSCSALTEMPIRKFRIHETCHGKLTFLTKNMSNKCNCRKGLHYELV